MILICKVQNKLGWLSINENIEKNYIIETYILFKYKIKNRVVKEVFGHLKRKLLNTCMDHFWHSLLFLIEFCESLVGQGIIVNQLYPSEF